MRRKPGPRCSSDTRNALQSISTKAGIQKKIYDEARVKWEEYTAAPDKNPWAVEMEWAKCEVEGAKFSALTQQLNDANKAFDATPEGIKSIEQLIAVSGNSVNIQRVLGYGVYDIGGTSSDVKSVEVKVPNKIILENRLTIAKEQREWQGKILKGLKQAEASSPSKALFVTQELKKNLASERDILMQQLSKKAIEYDTYSRRAIAKNGHTENPEEISATNKNKEAIIKNIVERNLIINRQQYLSMRISDLSSYEKGVSSKSDNEVKALFKEDLFNL